MKKLIALVLLLTFCYLVSSYGQRGGVEIRRGGSGGVTATNSPGNGTPALFLTAVTNADGSFTYYFSAPSATATNAQAPSAVLSNLVVTVASNVTNAHANIGTISVGILYPNAVLSNLVVNVANTLTNVNTNQFTINSGTINFKSGAFTTNTLNLQPTNYFAFTPGSSVTTNRTPYWSGSTLGIGTAVDTIEEKDWLNNIVRTIRFGTGVVEKIIYHGGPAFEAQKIYMAGPGNFTNGHPNGHFIVAFLDEGNNEAVALKFSAQDTLSDGINSTATLEMTTDIIGGGGYVARATNDMIKFGGPHWDTKVESRNTVIVDTNVQFNWGVIGELKVAAVTTFSNSVALRPFAVPANIGSVYGSNGNLQTRILTNTSTLNFLEMKDGQTIELVLTNAFPTNVLSFSGLSNTNFIDGFFGSIPSNRMVKFFIQKIGTHTNISYQGPVVELLAGSNISFATNTDTSLTISAAGGAGSIDGTFNTLWVTNWTRHSGGVSNMLWVFNSSSVSNNSWTVTAGINSNLSHVFIAGGLTNTSGEVSLSANNFRITSSPEIHSMIAHRFAGGIFVTSGVHIVTEPINMRTNNIIWLAPTLPVISQQTNVIVDFISGVWEAGNWDTNMFFLHATNGALGVSSAPTNLYTSIKMQPNVNSKLRFPATFNLLNFTNNCTISNGSKAHIVFSSNGSSQTNIDVAITGTQFP